MDEVLKPFDFAMDVVRHTLNNYVEADSDVHNENLHLLLDPVKKCRRVTVL